MSQAQSVCSPFVTNQEMQKTTAYTGAPLNASAVAYPCGFKRKDCIIQPISISMIHLLYLTVREHKFQSTKPILIPSIVLSSIHLQEHQTNNGWASTINISKLGSSIRPWSPNINSGEESIKIYQPEHIVWLSTTSIRLELWALPKE